MTIEKKQEKIETPKKISSLRETIIDRKEEREEKTRQQIARFADLYEKELFPPEETCLYEDELYAKLGKIVEGQRKFKIDHIRELGVEFDILIVLSQKNIGKTKAVYRLFREARAREKKVVYIRFSDKSMSKAITEFAVGDFNDSLSSPFTLVSTKSGWKLIDKETGEERGIAIDFKKCNDISGQEYEDYDTIIYDECIPHDTIQYLNREHFEIWGKLPSTITRSKKVGIKVYLFGNNVVQYGKLSILDFYNIDAHSHRNLRYIRRANEKTGIACQILYVSISNDWYEAYDYQPGAAQHAGFEVAQGLSENRIMNYDRNMISESDFGTMDPLFAFLYLDVLEDEPPILVSIRSAIFGRGIQEPGEIKLLGGAEKHLYLAASAKDYAPYIKPGTPILCDCIVSSNQYGVKYTKSLESQHNMIYRFAKADKILFHNKEAVEVIKLLCREITEKKERKLKELLKKCQTK